MEAKLKMALWPPETTRIVPRPYIHCLENSALGHAKNVFRITNAQANS